MFTFKNDLKQVKTLFNFLKKDNNCLKQINEYMSVDVKTLQIAEAFSKSMLKNYPIIPRDWENKKVNRRVASKMLEDYMTINTFKKYVDLNFFRHDKDKDVYLPEVEKYKEAADFIYNMYKLEFIGSTKEHGQDKIVLYPKTVNKLGLSEHNQVMRAGLNLLQQTWFKDWIEYVDTVS